MTDNHQHKLIVVDPDRCTGCHSCEMACSILHFGDCSPYHSRIRIQEFRDVNTFIPILCQACVEAPCIKVCPMNARSRLFSGAVVTLEEKCIGCHACIFICPFGAVMINPETGKTMSCDLCMDDTDGPWCVRACAMQQALQFVDAGDAARSRGREWAKKLKTEYEPAGKGNQDFIFSFSTT